MMPFGKRRALLGCTLGIFVAACGETGINVPLSPGEITFVNAAARTGVVGRPLPDPVEVLVRDSDGDPLAGVQVSFAATGSGASAVPGGVSTDAQGIARTVWTLGTAAGQSTLTATVAGGLSAAINAVGSAAAAASMSAASGNNQTAVAGSAVANPPAVRVVDGFGNPAAGVPVSFSVLSGGGTVTGFVRNTDSQGLAAAGSWVLGPTAGQQVLLARVEQGGVANNPVAFSATATAGGASQVTAVSATAQASAAGVAVPAPPSVRVTDGNGNPVPNVLVTFAVTAGGGQLTGASPSTNAQGIATVGSWTLGTTAGANRVRASLAGGLHADFDATGTPGTATLLVASAGNAQTAQIGRPVAIPPTVIARDAFNNPVPGVVVTFTATAGDGTVIAPRQVTDVTGTAAVGAWFLGTTPGLNTLTATAPGLVAVTFSATASAGVAVSMIPNSAIVQTGSAGTPVADPPSVVVRDINGNPVPGVVVTYTVTAGAGSIVGSPATTDQNGVAGLTSWTLGPLVASNTVVATSPGLPSITFTASPGAGVPATVVLESGDSGVAVQGTVVQPQPAVRVTDAHGNRVSGAIVTFAVTSGGGSLTGATQATDAAGIARVGSWTLGAGAVNRLSATVTGNNITGNPVVFTAQSATSIAAVSVPAGPITLDTDFSIVVRLRDAAGSSVALSAVPLTITIASGGGTLAGTATVSTDAAGQATFTVRVTGSAGSRTFTVSGAGLTPLTTGAISFN